MFCAEVFVGDVRIHGHDDRGSGTRDYRLVGTILVHNLTYDKDVGFHIKDGGWTDLRASYSHSLLTGAGNTIEVWECDAYLSTRSSLSSPPETFRFAAFYHNKNWDTWYWDNNAHHDYFVTAGEGSFTATEAPLAATAGKA